MLADLASQRVLTLTSILLQVDSKVSIVMEQLLRLLHHCGMPATDVDFINSDGPVMSRLLDLAQPRNTLFTGYDTNVDPPPQLVGHCLCLCRSIIRLQLIWSHDLVSYRVDAVV